MIKTIENQVTNTIVIEKSRFICQLFPVNNEMEAKKILKEIKKSHPKANHHCYAYLIKKEQQIIENQSDDGEPAKTAGLPMLEILRHENIVNVLAVVTRYFGGTLLGTGGLIRAYSKAVKQALNFANIKEVSLRYGYLINVDYSLYNIVEYEIRKFSGIIKDIKYGEEVMITFYIIAPDFINYLQDKVNNKIKITILDSEYL